MRQSWGKVYPGGSTAEHEEGELTTLWTRKAPRGFGGTVAWAVRDSRRPSAWEAPSGIWDP